MTETDLLIEKFSITECVKYIPAPTKNDKFEEIQRPCLCGEYAIRHDVTAAKEEGVLDKEIGASFCRLSGSNAFGCVLFESKDFPINNTATYARISDDDLGDILEFIESEIPFHDEPKDCCISILSCLQNKKLMKAQIDILADGIFEAAEQSNAIITLSGMDNEPIGKITERFWYRNFYQFEQNSGSPLRPYLAMSSWGDLTDRQQLLNKDDLVKYAPRTMNGVLPGLSRFHDTIILLDDGTRHQHPKSKFEAIRLKIETELASNLNDDKSRALVAVLVGGDYRTLLTIKSRIAEKIPTVVCVGTGFAADLLNLAEVCGKKDIRGYITFDEELTNRILTRVSKLNPPKLNRHAVLTLIRNIVNAKEYVSFCRLESIDSLRNAIMKGLIKSFNNDRARFTYAGKWNLTEIVRQMLRDSYSGSVSGLFTRAVSENTVELLDAVKLKFDSLQDLTPSWFHVMANTATEPDNIKRLLSKYQISPEPNDTAFASGYKDLASICSAGEIQRLLIEMFDNKFSKNIFSGFIGSVNEANGDEKTAVEEKSDFDFENLFLWSALMGRADMAAFFWTRCNYPMCLAIIACHIFRCSAKILDDAYDVDGCKVYMEHVDRFEELAILVANESLKSNNVAAVDLIGGGSIVEWNSPSALELAEFSDCSKFLSTLPSQEAIQYLWTSNLHCSIFKTLLGIFFPLLFLIPSFIHFDERYAFSIDSVCVPELLEEKQTLLQKVKRFYTCPRTKYVWQLFNFLLLLGITSYNLLFVMEASNIQILEAVTIALFIARILSTLVSLVATKQMDYLGLFCSLMFLLYCLLRISLEKGYVYAYTFYSIGLFFMYLEILNYCKVSVQLGPKVTMIFHMIIELMKFLPIFIIFMIPFGVAEQSTLYPHRAVYDIEIVATLFDRSFFRILGENYLEEANGEKDNCTEPADGIDCPVKNWFTILLIAAYVMLTVVLLMNLLIAIFSNIFEEVNNEALTIWKSKRYSITKSFHQKSAVPYPIGFIFEFISIIHGAFKKRKSVAQTEETYERRHKVVKITNERRRLEECCRIIVADQMDSKNQSSLPAKTEQVEKTVGSFEDTVKLSYLAAGISHGEIEEDDEDDYYYCENEEPEKESKAKAAKVIPLSEQISKMETQVEEINQYMVPVITRIQEVLAKRSEKKTALDII